MLDITAVATRAVSCPFPLVAFDSTDDDSPFALFVGPDKAAVVSLPMRHASITVRRFIPQYHRTLTAGVIRTANSEPIIALGDAAATVTIHRIIPNSNVNVNVSVSVNTSPTASTVFIGEAMDHTDGVAHIAPVWPNSEISFVCTRRGEFGTAWALCASRATAQRLRTPNEIKRIFPHRAPLPDCFAAAATAPRGFAVLSASSGDVRLRFDAPPVAAGPVVAVRSGRRGGNVFAALTASGAAALYDIRRAGPPLCDVSLCKLQSPGAMQQRGGGAKCAVGPAVPLIASYGGDTCDAWAALVAGQFHFMRSSGRDGCVRRSFALPDGFLEPKCVPRGLCFAGETLHVIASE